MQKMIVIIDLLQRRILYKLFLLCSNELIILRPSLIVIAFTL